MMLPRLAAARTPAADAPPLAWDDSPCPLCGGTAAGPVLEAPDPAPAGPRGLVFAVVRCDGCGLHYTNPRPDPETIGGFYPADYKPHRRPRKMVATGRSLLNRLTGRSAPERRGELAWHGAGRLLDFGCGGGAFLKRMADRGWQVTGLDAAVGAVAEVQREFGLKALAGTLPHPELRPGTFDVVTMWHALEHVHEPLEILREVHRLLVPGGRLIVACPNRTCWAAGRFGADWFGLDLPRHLTHFDRATLTDALTAAGFRVDRVRGVRQADWIRGSARLAVRRNPAAIWPRLLFWKPLAKAAAWLTDVCGGADSLMVTATRV